MNRKDVEQELREATATGRRPNFASKNLSFQDLGGLDFSGADLRKANLEGANLDRCLFVRADLYSANLGEANCYETNFSHANVKNTNFRLANLFGADFIGVDFFSTNLEGVDWDGLTLEGGPFGFSVIYPTTDGWMVQVADWIGTVERLNESVDEGEFPKLYGLTREEVFPYMRSFAAFARAHSETFSSVIEHYGSKWRD